ncbi:MAG: PEP-CTERM sorting domain-containing protein [Planctomycetota bacterium]|nr:PEP-CTERM sorting domain-containing protein [Planctomycetota bacterium]
MTGDVDIRGTGTSAATLDLNGHSLTANTLFVGRFNNAGQVLDDGAIRVNNLSVERSSLNLTGSNDIVDTFLEMRTGSQVTVTQAIGSEAGLTLNGNTLNILDTSVLDLRFDANTSGLGLDWAFRWANPVAGDRVATLNALRAAGRITVSAPISISIFNNNDGYTYIGKECGADLTGDNVTDGADAAAVFNSWGNNVGANPADFTGDGNVDGADLAVIFNCWTQADVAPTSAVPEPVGSSLLGLGFTAWLALRRRRA